MTRDELREKVAYDICKSLNENQHHNLKYLFDKEKYVDAADVAINTIFAALKEPTEEMCRAYYNTALNDSAYADWQAMLSASALAPKEK